MEKVKYSNVLIKYMEENMKDNVLLKCLKDDKYKWLVKWIDANPKSNLINILPNDNSIEVINFINKNASSREGLSNIISLSRSPNKIEEMFLMASHPTIKRKLDEKANEMEESVNSFLDAILPITREIRFFMHEDEYIKNFHGLFSQVEPIDKEDIEERVKAWIGITKGYASKVGILDKNDDMLFVHPGLISSMDASGIDNNWLNFTIQGEVREGKTKGLRDDFEKEYIDKYIGTLDVGMDSERLDAIRTITKYYDNKLTKKLEEPKEGLNTTSKEEWNSDLFE